MKFYDFEYDNLMLSDFGFTVCSFGSGGLETITSGSQLSFNTVPFQNGAKQEIANVGYDDCIESTFQICKDVCSNENFEISYEEYREVVSWLNRKGYYKFKILEDEYLDIYFEGSFNISKIEIDGRLYGLELNLKTNRPFALYDTQFINIKNITTNGKKDIMNVSDEEGYIYPETEITITQAGNLDIYNELENRHTYIANCRVGEVITMNYPIIESSLNEHKILDDFNWNFFRLAKKYNNNVNKLTISIPCTIKMKYNPIVKF